MQTNKKKIGRNAHCPCGSGRKYKNCCINTSDHPVAPVADLSAIPDMFVIAMAHHEAGRLREADAIYQQILQLDPNNHNAYHLLGLIARQAGELDIAVELISKAISIKPIAQMFYNMGLCLQDQGIQNDAVECYKTAIKMKPDYVDAYGNLGTILHAQRKLVEAINNYKNVIAIQPKNVGTLYNLGAALQDYGDAKEADRIFSQAVKFSTYKLATTPHDPITYNDLGKIFASQTRFDCAESNFNKAISIAPSYFEAHNNLGNALAARSQHEKALESFHNAITIKPDYYEALCNESKSLLTLGQLVEGWETYEYRLQRPTQISDDRGFTQENYHGQTISDKTILIWAEQGIGDEILFASVLPDIIKAANHCIIECSKKLVPLYQRSFPNTEVVPKFSTPHERTQMPDIDLQCPVGGLPRWFRGNINSFPEYNGYLVANEKRVLFWKDRLDALGPGLKVGISWRSVFQNTIRNLTYTQLNQWQAIFNTPGIVFVSLQYDECQNELAEIKDLHGIDIYRWEDIDLFEDLDEAAALTSALDLVISPGSSVFQMAGALGTEAWHLSYKPGILNLGTQYIPWYPNTKHFCKSFDDDWKLLLDHVANELAKIAI